MPLRFSVNLNLFFKEQPLPRRIARAAALGFHEVEFWGWWDEDLAAIAEEAKQHGVRIAGFCTKFVSLVDRNRHPEYLEGLRQSLETARRLDCPMLISQVGQELPGLPREAQHQALIDGLRLAAPLLEKAGVTLTIEPLNLLIDHKGYYLSRSDEAFEIVRQVGSPRVKVLFDVYHQQITEGNLINNIRSGAEWIGHYHIAGHPGRGEIGSGEIDYRNVLRAIAETGYRGSIGIELTAKGTDEAALKEVLELSRGL